MEMHVSDAIIMRIKEFGESDLLVTFMTPDMGRLKGVAKGGRKSRKRFTNCLDLFCLTKLEYGLGRSGDLYSLNSCRLIHAFPEIRSDFTSLSLASYMTELADILSPQNVAEQEIFELLCDAFFALENGMAHDILRIVFETRLMTSGGYKINFERCCQCGRVYTGTGRAVFRPDRGCIACLNCEQESSLTPGMGPEAAKALMKIQSGPWNRESPIIMNESALLEAGQVLKLHMDYRIGKRMKSAKYLE